VKRAPRLVSIAMVFSAGCATALKEPPPLSALQRDGAGSRPAGALLQEASDAYAKRPDLQAVRRAEELCLQAAQADEASTAGLVCAVRAKAWLVDREKDGKVRADLAVTAVQTGQWCLRRDPKSPSCKFWLGVALGLQARERHATAQDGLKRMVQLLREAAQEDPLLDEAGPERVLALLMVRAPEWPAGPGDVEEALVLARKAVELRPGYPPNQLAMGEVLLKNEDPARAREAIARAIELAGKAPYSSDPDAPTWLAEARALQQR
jgi:tetratricopeptide (TPR) repeat protein